ncbi:hypothetical protein MXB_5523, partial [Myxobolus squamalis]
MAECLNMIENGLARFKAQDPDPQRFGKVSQAVNDAITCYAIIYKEKKTNSNNKNFKVVWRLPTGGQGKMHLVVIQHK